MVGLATRLVIAERVRQQLPAGDRAAIDAEPHWYAFGALGPAIGDFVPSEVGENFGDPGRTPYWAVWKEVLSIAVGDPSSGIPGVAPVLRSMTGLLDSVSAAADDEDLSALQDLVDSGVEDVLDQAAADLTVILQQFSDPSRLALLGQLMGDRSRPRILDHLNLTPPGLWTGRDFLHWRSTGDFCVALRKHADDSGDLRLIAYSRGWQVTYAALTAGSGYMNSAVGSCYRTHWWRHRWVGNFVDAWVWGYYDTGASMAGDDPSPPFSDWTSLCAAGLQNVADVSLGPVDHEANARAIVDEAPLPRLLPEDFAEFWMKAYDDVYGSTPGGPVAFTVDSLQDGYTALLTMLWFQTSGDVIGCNPLPGSPPGSCGADGPPSWTDPTQINPVTGQPFLPEPPSPENDPHIAKIVSGVILALLGITTSVLGCWMLGAALVAGGIALIASGAVQPDWDSLRCDVFWLRIYLFNGLTALHNLTVLGGVQHPYPRDLAVDQLVLSFAGAELPYTSGAAVTKSKNINGLKRPWNGALSTWTSTPGGSHEDPQTMVWALPGLWPSALVDDEAANPVHHLVSEPPPGGWPGGDVRGFGPAVQAALALLKEDSTDLPSWNLDGDRGLGWLTWQLDAPYTIPVAPVPQS
ncbi:hypothetical protein [Cellulomonas bogoriensis]|uniref:Uncharacterized protein n=1 Tax=Cellulomonas bogoriensis 69B4 = DSM 16987 TaxID=1386082 RepID=A0A0A0BZ25_9CELL|nr:hypothetical protein [Cellulomonas bogoriensis]KGM13161.1 hypothetical protein N869_15745 [Cellulomonas bogoriensis 69B4 = DSM 16987]